MKPWIISLCFAGLAILGRVGFFIVTPIWLDFFQNHHITPYNSTTGNLTSPVPVTLFPAIPSNEKISVVYLLLANYGFCTLFWGFCLTVIALVWGNPIGVTERGLPKKYVIVMGLSQALSSIFANYSMSGYRTAPYLQAILSNCTIPIQFAVRFVVLRRRPTLRKLLCAVVVIIAEFVCLIPSIFPSLESAAAHQEDGGSTGAGAILWPMCFVFSMVPFAVSNSIMERSVQGKPREGSNVNEVNIIFFMVLWNFSIFLFVVVFFWAELIPGFGTASSLQNLADTLKFNLECQFGKAGCGPGVYLLGWANIFSNLIGSFSFAYLMRYSEGANYVIIVLTLRTPIVFIFWALFQENPFMWHPHAHLSTWLSIAAITVMIPAIYFYNTGSPERRDEETTDILSDTEDMDDETRPLLAKLENATIQQNGTVTREVQ